MDPETTKISQALVPSLINAVYFFIKNPNKQDHSEEKKINSNIHIEL